MAASGRFAAGYGSSKSSFLQIAARPRSHRTFGNLLLNTVLGLRSLIPIFDFDSRSLNFSRADNSGTSVTA
jgi:hypothetical protein